MLLPPKAEDLPSDTKKLRDYLLTLVRDQEIYDKDTGRMETVHVAKMRVFCLPIVQKLCQIEDQNEQARHDLLFKRWGTAWQTLDTLQPTEGSLLIVERADSLQAQCELRGGICWELKDQVQVGKWCHASQIKRWRKCSTPDAPATHETPASFVKEALERGRELKGVSA